jgi:creatinine amidohydrolase
VPVHHLKEMTWQDVDRLDRGKTVVTFACGPIEQHGPQSPLGTDLYIAEYVMRRCAGHLAEHDYEVIVAPTVPYVDALFSLPYPGSTSIRRRVVEEYLHDLLASLAADGFANLVLTSQHVDPPWIRTADGTCERVNEEYGARAIHGFERLVVDLLKDPSSLGLPDFDPQGEAHAGLYETAPMLYIQGRLVRKQLLEELPPQPIEFSRFGEAESFRELGNGLGYTGDLARATQEIGERIIDHYAGRFKDLILRHVRGEDVYHLLRFSGF